MLALVSAVAPELFKMGPPAFAGARLKAKCPVAGQTRCRHIESLNNVVGLIVIEGAGRHGKSTQLELLPKKLKARNRSPQRFFPQYESDSSALVKWYLRGDLASPDDVNPYAASAFCGG